jgi:hypothetical protein
MYSAVPTTVPSCVSRCPRIELGQPKVNNLDHILPPLPLKQKNVIWLNILQRRKTHWEFPIPV